MTKTERLQTYEAVREAVREAGSHPDYVAMNRLLIARHELSELIEALQAEGFGRKEMP